MTSENEIPTGTPSKAVAISFTEFRDEEIVRFFANDGRSFHPDSASCSQNGFQRTRLVGSPHFSEGQKPTAAFRSSLQQTGEGADSPATPDRKSRPRSVAFREHSRKTVPVPSDLLENHPILYPGTSAGSAKRSRSNSAELSFGKPTRPLGSVLMMDRGRIRKTKAARVLDDPLAKKSRKLPFPAEWRETRPSSPKADPAAAPESSPESTLPPESAELAQSVLERLNDMDGRLGRLVESWPRLSSRLQETIAALLEVGIKEGR